MDLQQQRRRLVELRRRLEGRNVEDYRENLKDSVQELSVVDNHPADVATEDYLDNLEASFQENNELLLRKIEEAIARLDGGEYQRCAQCGEKIPKARLLALPYATTCLGCARRQQDDPGFSHSYPLRGEFSWPRFRDYGTSAGDSELPPPEL